MQDKADRISPVREIFQKRRSPREDPQRGEIRRRCKGVFRGQGEAGYVLSFHLRFAFPGCQSASASKYLYICMTAGGSLGWKSKGELELPFEEVAFSLEQSTTGNPKIGEAKTGYGYHIIMVEGRK
ncbi:hypothetical protein BDV10DRAFT_93322 [Aspergillus recurvatus]